MAAITREEKLEMVERMGRAQAWQKKQIENKVQKDAKRAERLQKEKHDIFELRTGMRRDADKNKADIMSTLDQMKTKGKINHKKLA